MIPAIILAAGASSRMGRPKALLPLPDGGVFLSRIDRTLRRAGVDRVAAVIGHDADRIREAAAGWAEPGGPALRLVVNDRPERGQLSSFLVGLDAVLADAGSTEVSAVLLTTVDLPLVSAETVRLVIGAWQRTGAPVVRPFDGTRHGHPVVFSAALFEEFRAADPREGARAVVRAHRDEIVDVRVSDAGAFDDIDTPDDYRRLVIGE